MAPARHATDQRIIQSLQSASFLNSMPSVFTKITLFLSSLCVVHCLATPVVLVLLPAIAPFFSETAERLVVLAVVPVSLAGFFPTWWYHKNYSLLALFLAPVILILFSQFFLHVPHEELHDNALDVHTLARIGVTMAGALLLALSVYKNSRHTHTCTHPGHSNKHNDHPETKS